MSYFIAWTGHAHDRLERIWMAADNKRAITSTADAIDALLAADPFRGDAVIVGEEHTFIVEPLAVDYRVNFAARTVYILSVWMIGYLNGTTSS
jgi:hypothetical protein